MQFEGAEYWQVPYLFDSRLNLATPLLGYSQGRYRTPLEVMLLSCFIRGLLQSTYSSMRSLTSTDTSKILDRGVIELLGPFADYMNHCRVQVHDCRQWFNLLA